MNKTSNNKMTIIHGLLAIVFGVIVVSYPKLSVSLLATFFGVVLLIGGAVMAISAYRRKEMKGQGALDFILGTLSVVLAIVILFYPSQSVAVFLLLSVGIWAVITGAILIWAYIREYNNKKRPVTLIFGIASLFFGLFLAFKPMEGTYGVAVLVGIYAIFYGLHAIVYAFQKNRS